MNQVFFEKIKASFGKFDILLLELGSFYLIQNGNPGLIALASMARQCGFSARIVEPPNFFYFSQEDLLHSFSLNAPSVVGFYTISDNIFLVQRMCKRIKEALPNVVCVAGGPLATVLGAKLLEDCAQFDAVICGEGDFAFVDYVKYVIRGEGDLARIPSLCYRRGAEVLTNPRGPVIGDLEKLPVYTHEDVAYTQSHFVVTTGRGCPFACAFCSNSVHGKGYRFRSAQSVLHEITSSLENLNAKSFTISDDSFVSNPKRAVEICEGLIAYRERTGRDFIFYCEARVDVLAKHSYLLPLMKRAGLFKLQIGIESGDQKIIDAYGKNITLEQVEAVVKQSFDLGGFTVLAYFIVGGAFETEESVAKSIALACRMLEEYPGVFETAPGYFCPYPGTDISEHPERYDMQILHNGFYDSISTMDPTCRTKELSIERIRVLKQDFVKKVTQTMDSVLPSIAFERLKWFFEIFRKYRLSSLWLDFMRSKEMIVNYFDFLNSPRFYRLAEVTRFPPDQIVPMRTDSWLHYEDDGRSLRLFGGIEPLILQEEQQLFLYRRSCGKRDLSLIAQEFKQQYYDSLTLEEVIRLHILPFYEKLEKSLYMMFYV